jgi:arginase family enzyme
MSGGVHIDLDGAWDAARVGMRTLDARELGPHLRYTAPEEMVRRSVEVMEEGLGDEAFLLYGSGDFHYLAAWWLQRAIRRAQAERVTLVSFDNHPDWDVRPPKWACGGWVNRALDFPQVERASVWGCGNFELGFPARLFRNKRALASGKLEIHAWAERQRAGVCRQFNCMTRDTWRERLLKFVESVRGGAVYITVDLDALAGEFVRTNWENGLFAAEDVVWAVGELRKGAQVIGVDCCGAWSEPVYARVRQRFVGRWDHPKIKAVGVEEARAVNHRTLAALLPALLIESDRQ